METESLYRCTATLAQFDGMLPYYPVDAGPLEVLGADGKRIGWGTFRGASGLTKRWLTAQLVLVYDSPERLDLQVGERKLYAHLHGVFSIPEEPFEKVGPLTEDLMKGAFVEIVPLSIVLSDKPAWPDQEPVDASFRLGDE